MKKKNLNQVLLFPEPPYQQTVSEVQLIYRSKVDHSESPVITSSKSAYDILMACWDENLIEMTEQFKVIYLNRANKVLGVFSLATGGITGVVADPRHIVAGALKLNATGMIIAHNHPSQNLNESREDLALTKKVKEGAAFLDISLLDHLIVTKHKYMSFADAGLL